MNPNIIKEINKSYQQKKTKALFELEERKNIIYSKIPRLREIESEINTCAMKSINSILLCEKAEHYSYVKDLENKIDSLNSEKDKLLKENNISPLDLEPQFECDKCKDTGITNGQRCSCYEQEILNYSYNSSNLQNFANQTFANFNINLFEDTKIDNCNISAKQNMELLLNISKEFVQNFDSKEQKNLFFCGNTGLGKTYLSSCIANELLSQGKTVLYQTAPTLLDIIVDYKLNKNQNNNNFYSQVFNTDLLIIDDLGVEFLNNLNSVELFNIINNRLISHKNTKTIISTNLDLHQFRNRYDDRIVSRILGNYTICRFIGNDIRIKLR